VWWPAGLLTALNALSVDDLAKYHFTVGNTDDSKLLTPQIAQLNAGQLSTLAAKGVVLPYSNFPTTQTVRQSLYQFPQYTGAFGPGPNLNPANPPLGKTWYDGFQVVVTERLWHGLTANANYTYSKNLDLMSSPDIFNRGLGKNLSVNDLPHQFRLSASYRTPHVHGPGALSNRVVSYVLSDWAADIYLQYQSAAILSRPNSTGLFPISNYLGRGPGSAQLKIGADGQPMNPYAVNWTDLDGKVHPEPLDINCHCFDPTAMKIQQADGTFKAGGVLNPNAWSNVPDGQWANDFSNLRFYRGFRYPTENLGVGRIFRLKEGVTLNVRVEFSNAFNRLQLPQPTQGNALFTSATSNITTQTTPGIYQGAINGGFGSVVPISGTANSRTGLFVGRLTF
jgi:hypothetical protein